MGKKLKKLNEVAKDYGYKLEEDFGSTIMVRIVKRKAYVELFYDDRSGNFSISTSGSMWNLKDLLGFKKEFDETFELVTKLNKLL